MSAATSSRLPLILVILGVIVLSLVYASLFVASDYRASADQKVEDAAATAELVRADTESYFANYQDLFSAVAESRCVLEKQTDSCSAFFQRLNRRFPQVVNFAAVDKEGRFFASGRSFDRSNPPVVAHLPFFRELAAGKSHFIMDPHIGPISGNRVTGMVIPLMNAGAFDGIIGVSIQMKDLEIRWRELFSREPNPILVVDRNQQLIAASSGFSHLENRPAETVGNLHRVISGESALLQLEGESYRVSTELVPVSQWRILVLAPDQLPFGVYLNNNLWIIGFGIPLILLMVITLIFLRRDVRSVSLLEEREHDLAERSEQLSGANRELTTSLDNLRATQDQLIRSEKLSAVGTLVAGVAHEINTPLGIAITASSSLEDELEEVEQRYQQQALGRTDLEEFISAGRETLEMVQSNLQRADQILGNFKNVAVDQDSAEKRRINLDEYLGEVISMLYPRYKHTPYSLEKNCPLDLELETYPGDLFQIINNLVENSLVHGFAGRDEGRMKIDVSRQGDSIAIEYHDTGQGIDGQLAERLFDAFVTNKRGEGFSGLGMHIVQNLVEHSLHGNIRLLQSDSPGAHFRIELPLAS